MDFSWISLLLLTFVWTSAFHIYAPPSPMWILLIAAALVLSYIGSRRAGKQDCIHSCKIALSYCALVLLCQGAVLPFYRVFAARIHTETIFAPLAAAILNLFGLSTVCDGNLLYIDSFLKTIVFASTWEKLGALYLLLFAIGGTITLQMKKARVKHYLIFHAGTFLYALLRYVFIIMLYATYSMHSIFWENVITFATFIPYAIILTVFFRNLPAAPTIELRIKDIPKREAAITGILAFLLVFSGVSFFGFTDFGKEKPGRVLVDEYHSDWEWTTDIYDEQWYGERSGYNYYCFYNYLDQFYETSRNMDIINAYTLQDVDVFIMKTPTTPFSAEEIECMTTFVSEGGGLYLIGDHTNVFGTGANLNKLSKTFGITFNYDCTYELVNGNLSEYDAPVLMPHPVVSGLPHFLFATSNTLSAKWQAEEIMVGYGLKCLEADYSQMNFFPADTNAATAEFGLFLQSAGVGYGKGRVLAFTDSTVFSNFWMFMPGKPELLLKSVQWLNRENSFTGISTREVSAIFLILLLILNTAWNIKNRKTFSLPVFVLSGIAALLVGVSVFHAAGNAAVKLPEPIKPMVDIRFEREYSQFALPDDLGGFMSNMDQQLNTFYVWTQRLDYFPGVDEKLIDALQNGDLTIMAKPRCAVKNPKRILEEVSAGARLLILDNMESGGFSENILMLAGMELLDADMSQYADYGEIKDIPLTVNASAVIGGEVIIRDASGNSVLSVARIGDGLIAVFTDPDLFYSYELGDVSANLTDKTEILTQVEFKLLKSLLE